jgi:hypothetical protein
MKAYYIRYRMHEYGEECGISVLARNKEDAYDKAVYDRIPAREGHMPYSAWVSSVTYSNGKHKRFNTCEGMPY